MKLCRFELSAVLVCCVLVGCAGSETLLYNPKSYQSGVDSSLTELAKVSSRASAAERRKFMEAILGCRFPKCGSSTVFEGSPYEGLGLHGAFAEAFFVVSCNPGDRRLWLALARLAAFGDGEYAPSYRWAEDAAIAEFPDIFFDLCPDWQSLKVNATKS